MFGRSTSRPGTPLDFTPEIAHSNVRRGSSSSIDSQWVRLFGCSILGEFQLRSRSIGKIAAREQVKCASRCQSTAHTRVHSRAPASSVGRPQKASGGGGGGAGYGEYDYLYKNAPVGEATNAFTALCTALNSGRQWPSTSDA